MALRTHPVSDVDHSLFPPDPSPITVLQDLDRDLFAQFINPVTTSYCAVFLRGQGFEQEQGFQDLLHSAFRRTSRADPLPPEFFLLPQQDALGRFLPFLLT